MNAVTQVTHPLTDGWTLTMSGPQVPAAIAGTTVAAQVPGTTHTDLLRAGLIPDPYLDQNETSLQWMWRSAARYETRFAATPPTDGERIDLVFDGLDTVATITLNGTEVGRTANMHRTYRFDVAALIVGGENTLTIDFASALDYAETMEKEIGEKLHVERHPFNQVRKMACSFGWDWGPNLQTAGLWKPARLERWRVARLASVRPTVTVTEGGAGRVEVAVDVERASDAALSVWAEVGGVEARADIATGETSGTVVVEVSDVDLWWPHGHGAQPLYDLAIELHSEDEHLDGDSRRIGFRTVEVDQSKDDIGAGFTFVVNGRRIFVKGANWIPDDHLMTRITKDRLRERLTQALDAHMNLVRIWGGGIYESDDFYDLCDELGVMVWQDFLLACATYDEGEPLRSEIEAEVRDNVPRLMSHPSLVLWNGSNENIWGFFAWGWSEKIPDENWGLKYYTEVLPALVAELDPSRPYTPSSPFSSHHSHTEISPNDPRWGTVHEWKVWNVVDYAHYRDYVPRFAAEFGFQGPAAWSTIARTLPPEALDQSHPAWLVHQKADRGNDKLNFGLEAHLPMPSDFEAWHWATQLNQARALEFGIAHYRSHWPRCAGTIVWQLNDCWPVTSWAAIDGDGRKKPLWHALRRVYAPRFLTFQPRGADGGEDVFGPLHLVALNDSDEAWSETLTFTRMGLDGTEAAVATAHLNVPARGSATIEVPAHVATADDPSGELLVADAGYAGDPDHVRAVHTFAEDKDVRYEASPWDASAEATANGYRVTLRARGFARSVAVLADKVHPDAEASDGLIDLVPGDVAVVEISAPAGLAPEAFLEPRVLVSVNGLVA